MTLPVTWSSTSLRCSTSTRRDLSLLLRVRKAAIDRDARLKLAAPADPIWAVFASTGLEKVFDFAEDVPSALAGLQIG